MKATPLYQGDHQWWVLARDPDRPEKIIDTNQFLVVSGDRERLIPYIPDVVREVDLEAGIMRVDWDPDF